ncbi:matrin 3-like 1.1 isoform X2 [Hypomesus transpacificus]|uniref:matrin 3-like 1.1 isoform X2 n=1 Tax=Hypomesus transpacificus TaxID=137520 RepID=UPI001F087B1B|nr:matrin 3-like 1.1 isoform X2 [Hypomesus transpacificus]
MSHSNYPYRRPVKDSRSDSYQASDQLHTSDDCNLYRRTQEPSHSTMSSSSYTSRHSTMETHQSPKPPEKALSLLSSCGLKPEDLALLAELPEHLITVESLPGLLMEIKNKRRKRSSSSTSHSTTFHPPPANLSSKPKLTSAEWEKIRSQPVQYPLEQTYRDPQPQPLPPEKVASWQDRWGNPRQTGSITLKPSSSCASDESSYVVDYNFGKKANTFPSYERPSYSPAPGRSGSSSSAPIASSVDLDYRYATQTAADYNQEDFPKSRMKAACKMPSRKAALDFHGETPEIYPCACSLCDITVLSEKSWVAHVNGPQHADGQLLLLQLFPDWDCRIESIRRSDDQPAKPKAGEGKVSSAQRPNQTSGGRPENRPRNKKNKSQSSSKVVCAKFAAQTYEEHSLRRLAEQFGKVVKMIMFPSLAFVEMGSNGQAMDIVKYYTENPIETEGKRITFYVSQTFNFLQSSKVLSFTPSPVGKEGYLDLMAIAKKFGTVLYSLFLPSVAFVEMSNAIDAQKLVDYYSSTSLKIDGVSLQVAFSSEYSTLRNVPSTRKYEESSKRQRSPSPKNSAHSPGKDPSHKRKRRSRSKEKEDDVHSSREGERRRRSEEGNTRSSSKHSSPASSRSSHTRDSEKVPGPDKTVIKKTTSKPDEAASPGSSQPQTEEKTKEQGLTMTQAPTVEPASTHPTALQCNTQDKAQSATTDQVAQSIAEKPKPDGVHQSAECIKQEEASGSWDMTGTVVCDSDMDSDIEGMEVIGEDGIHMDDSTEEAVCLEDMEQQERLEDETKSSPPETETAVAPEEKRRQAEEEEVKEVKEEVMEQAEMEKAPSVELSTAAPSGQEPEPKKDGDDLIAATTKDEEEEDPDFPESLENCITLDELDEEHSEEEDKNKRHKSRCHYSRVIYVNNLPFSHYTDVQFVKIVKGFGKVVRYFLIRNRREGFLEMSSSEEATRTASELNMKPIEFNGSRLGIHISRKYHRLTAGWRVESDSELDSERRGHRTRSTYRSKQTRSRSHSKPKAERNDSAKKTPEKEEPTAKKDDSSIKTEKNIPTKKAGECEESVAEKEDLTAKATSKNVKERSVVSEEQAVGSTTQDCDENGGEADKLNTPDSQASDEKDSEGPQDRPAEKTESREEEVQTQPDPIKTWVESFKPNNPVGMEFVRPVVGYFCNLCQVIYADEDEAKKEHCSSLSHYQKFMEQGAKT